MVSTELKIHGVYLIELTVFEDSRGSFRESFNLQKFNESTGFTEAFIQDNHSISKKNVFRGLHFQRPPFAQAKLVRVTRGAALDVFLDIRKNSSTYGMVMTQKLDEFSNQMLFLPKGIAHGFLALEENTHFHYKCSNYYEPSSEGTIDYKSVPQLGFQGISPVLNEKDLSGELFSKFSSPF